MRVLPLRFRPTRSRTASRRFWSWLVALAIGAVVVAACYAWVDRPVALWVYAHQSRLVTKEDLSGIARIPNPAALVSVVVFVLLGIWRLARWPFGKLERAALASSGSVLIGEAIKDILKWVFGRPSPDLWEMSSLSATAAQNYQLHWFNGVEPFNSFPSGHMTAAAAVIAVLWMRYPKFRAIYALCLIVVATGLVALNFHFLADVIAGALLGATIGIIVSDLCPGHDVKL